MTKNNNDIHIIHICKGYKFDVKCQIISLLFPVDRSVSGIMIDAAQDFKSIKRGQVTTQYAPLHQMQILPPLNLSEGERGKDEGNCIIVGVSLISLAPVNASICPPFGPIKLASPLDWHPIYK